MNKTLFKILLLALYATFSQCQLSSPKQIAGNCDYYYEKDLGRAKVVVFLKDNFKTVLWGIYDSTFGSTDTIHFDPNISMSDPKKYSIIDSKIEENKSILISRWGNTSVKALWGYKKDSHWKTNFRVLQHLTKRNLTEVKILDIEHIRVIADEKTTIYTIDYENNKCFSDDEK